MKKFEPISLNETYSQMKDQLWSIYFDTEKHGCIGIIELSKELFDNNSFGDFDKNMPLAYIDITTLPENEEAKLNILCDLIIISACPNMFLLLQAIHENKSQETIDFYYKAFCKFKNSIQSNIEESHYESLERVHKSFVWNNNTKGYLINQYGQKVVRFIDPKLAKWVSLIGSQFSIISKFKPSLQNSYNSEVQESMNEVNHVLKQLMGNEKFNAEINKNISSLKHETKIVYSELKKSLPDLDWNIDINLAKMKIFLD